MTEIVLADGDELVREGIAALLDKLPGCRVTGQFSEPRALIDGVNKLKPEVAVVDSGLSGSDALDWIGAIFKSNPEIRIVLMISKPEEATSKDLTRLGVTACVLKGGTVSDLARSLHLGSHTKLYLSEALARAIRISSTDHSSRGQDLNVHLTHRECEILKLIGEGYSTKQIAVKLNISQTTVKTHRDHLMDKLEVREIAGLTREAIRLGLVDV